MLDSLLQPIRIVVAGPRTVGKSSFLNLLLIALHNLPTFPLHVGRLNQVRGTVRMRCIRAHANLVLVDTIGLQYESPIELELLYKILRGVSDQVPHPVSIDRTVNAEPTLIKLVTDSLVVDHNQVVDQVIWLVNPVGAEEINGETGEFWLNEKLLPNLEETFMMAGSIVSTQLPPFLVYTHGDEIKSPRHAVLSCFDWQERSRKRVVANYTELPDPEAAVQRSFERELVALQLLAEALVQCQPLLARFLRS